MSDALGPLNNFILPGGSPGAAHLHVARCVCRRAERLLVTLARIEPVGGPTVPYLNRLSDALFVMARWENQWRGIDDVCGTRAPEGKGPSLLRPRFRVRLSPLSRVRVLTLHRWTGIFRRNRNGDQLPGSVVVVSASIRPVRLRSAAVDAEISISRSLAIARR